MCLVAVHSVCPSRMFVLTGSRLRSLTSKELLEVLRLQSGVAYDSTMLRIKKKRMYFGSERVVYVADA